MSIALIVPVLSRFDLFTRLMASVDVPVHPYVIDNYDNNRGVSGAWNEGMDRAIADGHRYAIISNDDVEFRPGTIHKLYSAMINNNLVIVSANQNVDSPEESLLESADFYCFMVDMPKLLRVCGRFDQNFTPAYFEDNDMHRRIILAGLTTKIHAGAKAFHHGSATQNGTPGGPVTPPHQFEQNRAYFIRKWGGNPTQESFSTPFDDPNKTIKDW